MDAETGETLWRFNNGTGHNGGIISYEAGGKQYVSMAAGHGTYVADTMLALFGDEKLINYQSTAALVTFALP